MSLPSAPTTAQIVSSLGTSSQEQAWSRNLVQGHLGRSIFTRVRAGVLGGKPIMTHGEFRNLRGQTANITVTAPVGGPGRHGSGEQRSGYGENLKRKVFSLTCGNWWNGISQNNISAAQTIMGIGSFDTEAKEKLKERFGQEHDFFVEAELLANTATSDSRLRIYGGSATSLATLGGAGTANQNTFRRISNRLAENMAQPFAVAGKGPQEIRKYLIIAPEQALSSLYDSGDWQDLIANSSLRGAENPLFTGEMPEWAGSVIVPWTVQNNPGDGTQGSYCSPIAFLGETIAAGTAAFTLKGGGGTASATALTTNLFFRHFPGAPGKYFERTVIAQETGNTKYALIKDTATGKFAMISYTTTDGVTITGVKKLGAAANGTVATTVGSIVWGSPGVWDGKLLDGDSQAITVGSPIWPCNAKGQCFKRIYGMGMHAFMEGWGSPDGSTALGRRTINNDDDHQRFKEIGFEEQYGINGVVDANGLYTGVVETLVAWNPDGAPTAIV